MPPSVKLLIVSAAPGQQALLVRKWAHTAPKPLKESIEKRVEYISESNAEDELLRKSAESRESRFVVVVASYAPPPWLRSVHSRLRLQEKGEVLLCSTNRQVNTTPSSSLLRNYITFSDPTNLEKHLRKAVLRQMTRQAYQFRELKTTEEFAGYFELRHRVWQEIGYESQYIVLSDVDWELDHFDLDARHFGLFERESSELLACGRFIEPFGRQNDNQRNVIQEALHREGKESLIKVLQPGPIPQFDFLSVFPKFGEYYRELITKRIKSLEASRIMVRKEKRNKHLGETMMDTLCSWASKKQYDHLFLACAVKHTPFYKKCSFNEVAHLKCKKFPGTNQPAVVMECQLHPTYGPGFENWMLQ